MGEDSPGAVGSGGDSSALECARKRSEPGRTRYRATKPCQARNRRQTYQSNDQAILGKSLPVLLRRIAQQLAQRGPSDSHRYVRHDTLPGECPVEFILRPISAPHFVERVVIGEGVGERQVTGEGCRD